MESLSFRSRPLPHCAVSATGLTALLVNLVAKGYRYYFTGMVKPGKCPLSHDRRLIESYSANLPKSARERRRKNGQANFRYLRHEHWFIVLGTQGKADKFWREDRSRIRHIRDTPIRFWGYSISYKQGGYAKLTQAEKASREEAWNAYFSGLATGGSVPRPQPAQRDMRWHVHVQLDAESYLGLKAYFLNIATHREAHFLAEEFLSLPFEPYGPVRNQYRTILRAVNQARALAGFQRIPLSAIRFRRRIESTFSQPAVATSDRN